VYLGKIYYQPLGVKRDCNKALYWYGEAAKQGDAEAQAYVAYVYDAPFCNFRDKKKSFMWTELSAKQGLIRSMHNMGAKYYKGDGVGKDVDMAKLWWEKAAESGYGPSRMALDELNLPAISITNCKVSNRELLKEAEKGNRLAQRVIGFRYSVSRWSDSSQRCRPGLDHNKAFFWLSQAAKQGERYAQREVGRYYMYGRGDVRKSDVEAYAWLILAAQHGLLDTCTSVNYLEETMESDDLEEAKGLNLKYWKEYSDEEIRSRVMGDRRDVCGCCSKY
jgi:hypothetical protein